MTLDRIKRAILCRNCYEFNILRSEYHCTLPECNCSEDKVFDNVLDWYAFLYTTLNNMNYIDYETLSLTNAVKVEQAQRTVERTWKSHMKPRIHLYTNKAYITLHEETWAYFKELIQETESLEDLLLRIMCLLYVLDEHLVHLKIDYMLFYPEELPIQTSYGELVHQWDSVLLRALQGHPSYKPPIDPNYLSLPKRMKSFHVARAGYSYYRVKHRYLVTPRYTIENVLDMKLGFLPGEFNLTRDYALVTDEELTDDGALPFYFRGVNSPETYYSRVITLFGQLLEKNPHILILPELFTPPTLRENLIRILQETGVSRLQRHEINQTILFLTGSFHEQINENIYNLAHVISGDGQPLLEVNKMNRFILQRNDKYEGELSSFIKNDGIEKNAYDRREITFFETWLGRIAFFICIDFINHNIEEVLIDRQVDIIFVMAMTPNPASGKFIRRMQDLAERNGSIVIVCNNLGKANANDTSNEQRARVVVSLPGFKEVFQNGEESSVYSIRDILEEILNTKNL